MTSPSSNPLDGHAVDYARVHQQSDLDSSTLSQHHSLGVNPSQASPGDHTHDGRSSKDIGSIYAKLASVVAIPSGAITMYGGGVAPSGWLLCDGSGVSRTTYAALFTAIGAQFGAGDGSTTFNLPNFQTRMPLGVGTTAMGQTGGSTTHTHATSGHTLTAVEMPNHTHAFSEGAHNHSISVTDNGHGHTENNHTHGDDHYHTEGNHSHDQGTLKAWRAFASGTSNNPNYGSSYQNNGATNSDVNITGATGVARGGGTGSKSVTGFSGSTDAAAGSVNTGYANLSASTGLTTPSTSIGYTGSGGPHDHGNVTAVAGPVDPYLTVNFIIKT